MSPTHYFANPLCRSVAYYLRQSVVHSVSRLVHRCHSNHLLFLSNLTNNCSVHSHTLSSLPIVQVYTHPYPYRSHPHLSSSSAALPYRLTTTSNSPFNPFILPPLPVLRHEASSRTPHLTYLPVSSALLPLPRLFAFCTYRTRRRFQERENATAAVTVHSGTGGRFPARELRYFLMGWSFVV